MSSSNGSDRRPCQAALRRLTRFLQQPLETISGALDWHSTALAAAGRADISLHRLRCATPKTTPHTGELIMCLGAIIRATNPPAYPPAHLGLDQNKENIQNPSPLVSVLLILTVPTCTDGVQNGDEPAIDCGGSCTTCRMPSLSCSAGLMYSVKSEPPYNFCWSKKRPFSPNPAVAPSVLSGGLIRFKQYRRCKDGFWLDQYPSTAQGCLLLVIADSRCDDTYFTWAEYGDKNCFCVSPGDDCPNNLYRWPVPNSASWEFASMLSLL